MSVPLQRSAPSADASQTPHTAHRRRVRWWRWLTLILLAAAGYAVYRNVTAIHPQPVGTAVAHIAPIEGSFTAEGYVVGRDYKLASEVSGKVVNLNVREGAAVRRGDVLFQVDSADALENLREARSSVRFAELEESRASAALDAAKRELRSKLHSAEAVLSHADAELRKAKLGPRPEEFAQAEHRIEKARALEENAQKDLQRADLLFREGAIARSALDLAQSRYASARADTSEAVDYLTMLKKGPRPEEVAVAERQVDTAKAALSEVEAGRAALEPLRLQKAQAATGVSRARTAETRARNGLHRTGVKSPANGTVSRLTVESGTVVQAGVPVITLSTREDLHIEAEIGSEDAGKIHNAMRVTVTSPAYPGRSFPAKLVHSMPVGELKPDSAIRTRIIRARVMLDKGWQLFKPGVDVDVEGRTVLRNALCIPNDALTVSGNDTAVFVVENGLAHYRPVRVGASTSESTEILSGLKPNEVVVIKGKENLKEGAAVRASADKR